VRKCLNTITLGSEVPFERCLTAASKAGFQSVEIFHIEKAQAYAKEKSMKSLKSLLGSSSLEAAGFLLGGFLYEAPAEFSAKEPRRREAMAFAQEIGATDALLFIPSKGKLTPAQATETAVQRAGETADMAADYGIRIGLEPIGKCDFFNTPSTVLPLIRKVKAPNLGLTIDLFHFFTGGCATEDLRRIPADRIFLIHMDDAPALPIAELDDSKRVLPGQGGMNVVEFIKTLDKMGYEGDLSVELFSKDLWSKEPEFVAKAAKKALDSVMSAAGAD